MSDVSGPLNDDLDPDRFITRAKQAWQATADAARADYQAAREPSGIARTAIVLFRVLRGPGYRAEADEVVRDAVFRCRPAALRGEPEALEAVADLVLHAGRSAEAIRLFEEAAAAGSADAMQQIIEVMLDGMLVGAGARVQEVARALPARERQVLALTGLGTSRDAYAYAGEVLAIPAEEVGRAADRGLAALAPVLALGRVDTGPFDPDPAGLEVSYTNIGGVVYTGGFDPDFEDSTTMPGEIIGSALTNDERAMIQLMDPRDRARYLLQKRIQEKAEMAVLLSQLQSLRHQTAMSVINNIR